MSTVTQAQLLRYGLEIRRQWELVPRNPDVPYPISVGDIRMVAWTISSAANAMVHTLLLQPLGYDTLAVYMQVNVAGVAARSKSGVAKTGDFVRWTKVYPEDRKSFIPKRSVK